MVAEFDSITNIPVVIACMLCSIIGLNGSNIQLRRCQHITFHNDVGVLCNVIILCINYCFPSMIVMIRQGSR